MEATLNLNNYTDKEILDLFGISEQDCKNKNKIKDQYNTIVENIKTQNEFTPDFKRDLIEFLTKALDRMIEGLKQDYKLAESSFTPNLEKSETFNNEHQVIKKNNKKSLTSLINPIRTDRIGKLLNINTVFRDNYYNTRSSDFTFNLPAPINNVIGVSLETAEIENTYYAFNALNRTNEIVVEIYNVESANGQPLTAEDGANSLITQNKKKIITIKEGNYTGESLADYLNLSVFSHGELARIACKYDSSTRKFSFFKDNRDADDGGLPDTNTIWYRFNLDFRLAENPDRPIQLNMGWILGYRQQYYDWDTDFTDSSGVSYNKQEGYNPEATYDTLGSKYYILSVDDFNKNYSNTLTSPFQESMFNDQNAIAKIPNNPNLQQLDDIFYQSRREYFGPVNIKKMHIKLLDELGRVVNLNNNDYSFSIVIEQLYDAHANKIFN